MNSDEKKLGDALVHPFEEATRLAEAASEKRRAANAMLVEPCNMKTAHTECSPAKVGRKKAAKKVRGIYEKVPGSGEWWIRYADATGKIRREKAGTREGAQMLLHKRKQEALEGRKLPETLRARPVTLTNWWMMRWPTLGKTNAATTMMSCGP